MEYTNDEHWGRPAVLPLMEEDQGDSMQYVHTGEVRCGKSGTLLNSGAIGSCVIITAFDPVQHVGAMAHIMLPGACLTDNTTQPIRYAANAMDEMFEQLNACEVGEKNIEVCVVGGANVLKREKDTIGKDNLQSVLTLLQEKQIGINATAIGGYERRTVIFDIGRGCIYYTEGDAKRKILWQMQRK